VSQLSKTLIAFVAILAIIAFVGIPEVIAQCPMCRMSAESNLQNGGTGGKGLNAGILFMLSLPYLIVGSIGYIWWKNQKKVEEDLPAT
jgi:hypothetical protein